MFKLPVGVSNIKILTSQVKHYYWENHSCSREYQYISVMTTLGGIGTVT